MNLEYKQPLSESDKERIRKLEQKTKLQTVAILLLAVGCLAMSIRVYQLADAVSVVVDTQTQLLKQHILSQELTNSVIEQINEILRQLIAFVI